MSNEVDWKFNPYEKIPGNFDNWKISAVDYKQFSKTKWVVTEKIHGANFCIISDGKNIHCAKRKSLLAYNDTFFNFQQVLNKVADKVKKIYQQIYQQKSNLQRIAVYGELFGGCYPHPDVPSIASLQPIQTGVYYSPTIEFCVFDIAIEEQERHYLDYDKVINICDNNQILCAQPLYIGKYEQALAYPICFNSKIPALFHLPPLGENKAEGVVIKPMKSFYVESKKGKQRPILKKKIPEFAEQKYHQAQKWPNASPPKAQDILNNYVTANRLANVISKFGAVAPQKEKQIQLLLSSFVEDCLDEFTEEWNHSLKDLDKLEEKTLLETLETECLKVIRQYFSV